MNKFKFKSRHISWQAVTNDKDVLSTVSSMPIEFNDGNFSLEGSTFPQRGKIFKLRERNIIKRRGQHMNQGNLSHQFC